MKRKLPAMLLCAAMMLSLIPASAAGMSEGAKDSYDATAVEGYNISVIPSNVAETLALMFVDSNVEANLTDTLGQRILQPRRYCLCMMERECLQHSLWN